MTSMLADVVGTMSYEVVAAASLAAAASVAAAAVVCTRRQKRKLVEATSLFDDADTTLPRRKKQRGEGKSSSSASAAITSSHYEKKVYRGVAVTTEPTVNELKRKAQLEKWRHKVVYTFLDDHGREIVNYTFEEIDRAARRIAATLQTQGKVQKGDRVMLCYPPGLDFALGFWGCLYAGAIGIPVYPPYPGTLAKDLPKFNRMVDDSGAKVILTNRTYHLASKMATVKGYFSTSKDKQAATTWPADVQWFTTDSIADSVGSLYVDVPLTVDDIAFFQYSSGSTSEPKAVMISHGNLCAQLKTWESILPSDTLVSWLPSYHDMGLVGFIITPCITAGRCVSMSPISFIKDPALWMRTVSKYKATHVCAPNFGYALAARKTSDEEAARLDLSHLKQTICAAEPIREESLKAFTSKFEKASGFNPKTFNCGYGLAEVTLVCTGQNPLARHMPTVLNIKKSTIEAHRKAVEATAKEKSENVMTLVGCGKAMPTFAVTIVDPDTKKPLKELQVGEIWVQGPSVAAGYWNRPEYTKEMFGAQLAGEKNTNNVYLRTGDMGFLRHGELFVTGRLKDLIIIRGRNVCPQDVEASVEQAHGHVRPGCVAAFSIEKNQEEALVIVAEARNASSQTVYEEICSEIIKTVLSEHQLKCEAIVLLRQKTIPKTTSGKIQRSATKINFLANTLSKPLFEYKAKESAHLPSTSVKKVVKDHTDNETQDQAVIKTNDEILAWLLDRLSQELQGESNNSGESSSEHQKQDEQSQKPADIDPSTPWANFGMDSIAIVGLSSELGEFLGCVVPPSAFFQYDTPLKLANAPGLATGELETGPDGDGDSGDVQSAKTLDEVDESCYQFEAFPEVKSLFGQMREFKAAGLRVPFLETLTPEKRKMVNFNTYNYLGNASNSEVLLASKKAIEQYGTTMSSSPIVGQTQVNVDLEATLCSFFRAEASVLFVGGWVANVTTIDALVSKGDLILCDALNHDSCVTGQRLSGATILPFPHNDTAALERMLSKLRLKYRRVLIVIEGVYSMDGDIPNLPEMVRIKKKYKSLLFVDEAHSFGTMGKTGRGLCEHFDVDPKDIDVRMGTMSKALGSIGGFMLGSSALIKYLKHCAGGFVFSVGLAPSAAAAALKSVQLITAEATRTETLQERSSFFYDLCIKNNIPVGATTFRGAPVVVVMIGSTISTAKASQYLAEKANVNVKPIVYPAVEEGKCRLRFFISALHTKQQLEHTVTMLRKYLDESASVQVNGSATIESSVSNSNGKAIESNDAVVKVVKEVVVTKTTETSSSPAAKANGKASSSAVKQTTVQKTVVVETAQVTTKRKSKKKKSKSAHKNH